MSEERFEPVLVGFTCNWCSYRAADLAGTARVSYPANIRLIRLMCSGRLDPSFVLKAFAEGADGVLIAGCHPGECHYLVQNMKALRRFRLLRRVLERLGIDRERVRLTWASAAEGTQFAETVRAMTEEVRRLGPLGWPRAGDSDRRDAAPAAANLDAENGHRRADPGSIRRETALFRPADSPATEELR